jgi:uncharacterized cupin superfamily protein
MQKANIYSAALAASFDHEGKPVRRHRVGEAIGATQIGGSLYELAEDEGAAPFHFHHGTEEWLIVIAGSPTVCGNEGERVLRRGDLVCFPDGPAGAHQVRGPGTVFLLAEQQRLAVAEYPDQDGGAERGSGPPPQPAQEGHGASGTVANLFESQRSADEGDPEGYQVPYLRFGPLIGAAALGLTVYELTAGQSICPYHYEYPEEEWLIVLEGTPTLRNPVGEHELAAGDLVCFPSGPEGAHKVTNRSAGRALVAMVSTKSATAVAVYPDSNKVGVWSGDGDVAMLVPRGAAVDYWVGEI